MRVTIEGITGEVREVMLATHDTPVALKVAWQEEAEKRRLAAERALMVLDSVQPPNGGFLEAIPLTSFVVMSLLGSGKAAHPAVWSA